MLKQHMFFFLCSFKSALLPVEGSELHSKKSIVLQLHNNFRQLIMEMLKKNGYVFFAYRAALILAGLTAAFFLCVDTPADFCFC